MIVVVKMRHSMTIAVVDMDTRNMRLVFEIGKVAHPVSCSIETQSHGMMGPFRTQIIFGLSIVFVVPFRSIWIILLDIGAPR